MESITVSIYEWIGLGLIAFVSVCINVICLFRFLINKYPVLSEEVEEESVKEHELKENIFKAYRMGFNTGYKKGVEQC